MCEHCKPHDEGDPLYLPFPHFDMAYDKEEGVHSVRDAAIVLSNLAVIVFAQFHWFAAKVQEYFFLYVWPEAD